MELLFQHKVLSKYDVEYFICSHCHLIQTEEPYWLEEAYKSAISALDTGILHRNIRTRRFLEPLIELLGLGQGTFADIGGGYGTLTRLMRDIGYNCNTHDIFCENIFAKGFEAKPDAPYDALLSFEVMEHLYNPVTFLQEEFLRKSTKTVILSTQTYNNIPGEDWWYYAFHSGQHISFFHKKTLRLLAEKIGCQYYGINNSIHLITDRKIGYLQKYFIGHKLSFWLFAIVTRLRRIKRTKIFTDHELCKIIMTTSEDK